MRRKGLWFALLLMAVAGLVAAMGWVEDQRAVDSEVGWSPLYERRVTDALVPATSQEVRGAARAEMLATAQFVTCACATAFDLPCDEPVDVPDTSPTSAAVTCDTCDEDPLCQGAPDQTAVADLYDLYTFQGATCQGMSTCDQSTCYCPTLDEATCTRPTCDGPTCGGPTCEGETCFLKGCDVLDYGDAPRVGGVFREYQYPTKKDQDGARHVIDGVFYLGAREDAESDGKPSDLADGDDGDAYGRNDDEDGAWFPTTFNPGRKATLIARASQPGKLFAWLDCGADGSWEDLPDGVLAGGVDAKRAYNWISIDIPRESAATASSYARFRFVESGKLRATGEADNGEVEDYRVVVLATFRAWVMTDNIRYAPGNPVKVSVYLNETAQVTITLHRPNGTQKPLVTTTAEVGFHVFPTSGDGFVAELPAGTSTIEVVTTSLKSGVTVWLTTPYDVSE